MSEWTPQTDNPTLTLAAIRWYVVSIEKLANDIYITNPEQYPQVKAALSTAFETLGHMRKGFVEGAEASARGRGKPDMMKKVSALESYATGSSLPKPMMAQAEDGCGPGYVNCNGVCLPECDNFFEY